jgi:CIC family chloride channel protein
VMLMVAEMTGNLTLLAPAMLAVSIATLICGENTIYVNQVDTRVDSPAHRYRFSFPLLASLAVGDVIGDQALRFKPSLSIRAAIATLVEYDASGAPVVDERGGLLGVVTRADLSAKAGDTETTVGMVMTRDPVTIETDDTLDTALEQIASHRISWLPVLTADGTNQLAGVLTTADVSRAYRQSMNQGVRRLSGIISGGALLEVKISEKSPVAGKALRELNFPPDTLVVSVRRSGEMIFPRGDTELHGGDTVMALTSPISEPSLREYLGS